MQSNSLKSSIGLNNVHEELTKIIVLMLERVTQLRSL